MSGRDVRASVFLDSPPDIVSSAQFVLIVEKDATFQRLLDDDFCAKLSPCIMITVCVPSVVLLSWLRPIQIHPHTVLLLPVLSREKVSQMSTAG